MKPPESYKDVQKLTGPAISGQLTTWAIELSEFDISYEPRVSIKAQDLADFIVEYTTRPPQRINGPEESHQEPMPEWTLYVYGARNNKGSGVRLLIYGPKGIEMEYAIRFNFEATNNEADYEALVAGLELVRALGVRRILVRGDSKLMMDHIRGECGINNGSLMRYHNKATALVKSFAHIVFEHIPRFENEKADRLSKLTTTYYEELPKEVYIEVREQRTYEEIPVTIILEESSNWKTDIAKFLLGGSLPADPNEAKKLQRRSLRFCLYECVPGKCSKGFIRGPDTYELEEMDGKPIPRTWYASKLSKFYC
ncbi:hypothetical protein LIER_19487 [Lithospermum erythrorhizon]|uniref:RNase H type-1 domain-containing protein n=1 Tax=Lithospermum erythrorhizon TaxID=34254 RepID=A0AAV3QKY1_LITER